MCNICSHCHNLRNTLIVLGTQRASGAADWLWQLRTCTRRFGPPFCVKTQLLEMRNASFMLNAYGCYRLRSATTSDSLKSISFSFHSRRAATLSTRAEQCSFMRAAERRSCANRALHRKSQLRQSECWSHLVNPSFFFAFQFAIFATMSAHLWAC